MSCNKKPVINLDSNFEGKWFHYETAEKFKYLTIHNNSKGDIYTSEGWENGLYYTQTRKWFIRNQTLEFGHGSPSWEKFEIDSFPVIAIDTATIGENRIEIGDKYMWLDGRIYVSGE